MKTKPNFTQLSLPTCGEGTLPFKGAPTRPLFPDAGFGKHWPFFPFAILFALVLFFVASRMQAHADSEAVDRFFSSIKQVNSQIKNFGYDTLSSAPEFGMDSWKNRGTVKSEIYSSREASSHLRKRTN